MLNIIPIYAQAGITGFESPAAEYIQLGLSLDELLIQNPSATFIGFATGHSMESYGIYHGDVLIVDRSIQPTNSDIIVANLNGVFVCKAIDRRSKQLLSGDNCEPYVLGEGDVFEEEGVVLRSVRMFRRSSILSKCLV